MNERITADEFMETLTGYDEIAIEKAFSKDVMGLAQGAPTTLLRSLVFVEKRREGLSDKDAKDAVLQMSLREVNERFAQDDEEPMPEEPVTEAGKDDSQPE